MTELMNRRKFLASTALTGAAIGMTGPFSIAQGGKSPNEKVVVAIMGGRARAARLARTCAGSEHIEIGAIYDVDERPLDGTASEIAEIQGRTPSTGTDFREALENPDIDGLVIGAPNHWHTPAAIMAMQAGKHVYVEKPGSQNAREAELLVEAQRRYGKVVQTGNQGRSSRGISQAIQEIRNGIIGEPYYAKGFRAGTRENIGHGRLAGVPSWLDYDLWQGPAPRVPYRDNVVHYNWHWFRHWGCGELLNHGSHRIEYCRWALGVDLPVRINSSGGRYHYNDDWEFPDTQNVNFDFQDGKSINWESRSRNGFPYVGGRTSDAIIYGTEGTVALDGNECPVYDLDGNEVKRIVYDPENNGPGTLDLHFENFANAIRYGEELASPVEQSQKTMLMLHMGNIAHFVGRSLNVDPISGRIVDDPEAMKLWSRDYEPGWEPTI